MINLTGGIPDWFVSKFSDDIYHECQQTESYFAQAVTVENDLTSNEDKGFDQMGKFSLQKKTGRAPKTPRLDITTGRRWVSTDPYHNSYAYDKDDDLSIKLAPMGDFVQAFAAAVQRKKDDIILASFEAAVTSGKKGGSSITWASQDGNVKYTGKDTGRTIAHDCAEGNCSASDTGMTTEKIELILEYFANNHVSPYAEKWCAISPRMGTHLFGQEEYVNTDYNKSRPLTDGGILRNWMGLNWIVTPEIEVGSNNDVDGDTNVYECWAWTKEAIKLGVADELTIEIDKLVDDSYAQQVYVHMNMGAMRFDEDKVIKIECQATQ